MILREFWGLEGPSADSIVLDLPLAVLLPGGTATLEAGDRSGGYLLRLERSVGPESLRLRRDTRTRREGSEDEIAMIEVDRAGWEGADTALDVAGALSFLTDQAFTVSRPPLDDELVPETTEDEAVLERLGTREVWLGLSSNPQIRTFVEPVTPELVAALLPKAVGLRLYADAIRQGSDTARYRDLWRVLESAFTLQDDELIAALAAYPPATDLEFDADELRELLVLRGRASHARSRTGRRELRQVRADVLQREGRLKSLVERVLMTKTEWGSRSAAVQELSPLRAWVGRPAVDDEGVTRSRIVMFATPTADTLRCANCHRLRLPSNAEWRVLGGEHGLAYLVCPACSGQGR